MPDLVIQDYTKGRKARSTLEGSFDFSQTGESFAFWCAFARQLSDGEDTDILRLILARYCHLKLVISSITSHLACSP